MQWAVQVVRDNPEVVAGLVALLASIWPVWKAMMAALQRRINRAWDDQERTEHKHDPEVEVQIVTTKVQASSTLPLPRGVVERRVRLRTPIDGLKLDSDTPPSGGEK